MAFIPESAFKQQSIHFVIFILDIATLQECRIFIFPASQEKNSPWVTHDEH